MSIGIRYFLIFVSLFRFTLFGGHVSFDARGRVRTRREPGAFLRLALENLAFFLFLSFNCSFARVL